MIFSARFSRIKFFFCLHFGNQAWVSVGFLILRLFAFWGFFAVIFFFSFCSYLIRAVYLVCSLLISRVAKVIAEVVNLDRAIADRSKKFV